MLQQKYKTFLQSKGFQYQYANSESCWIKRLEDHEADLRLILFSSSGINKEEDWYPAGGQFEVWKGDPCRKSRVRVRSKDKFIALFDACAQTCTNLFVIHKTKAALYKAEAAKILSKPTNIRKRRENFVNT